MATSGFDATAELNALRELCVQCSAAAMEAEQTLLGELDGMYDLCRQFAACCEGQVSMAQNDREAALKLLAEQEAADPDEAFFASLTKSKPLSAGDSDAKLRELQLEMEQLRAELKSARRRLSDEKRKTASKRDGWESELSDLRKAFEPARPASEAPRESPAPPHAVQPARKPAAAAATSAADPCDPVLGAVLAQFQKLHQNGARS
jgi:hypothetical protein